MARSDIAAQVCIRDEFGWSCVTRGTVSVWVSGYGGGSESDTLARYFSSLNKAPSTRELGRFIRSLGGHFAFVAQGKGWAVAAVDRVRSIAVAFAKDKGDWLVDNQAHRLKGTLGLGPGDADAEAALALGMAGYTVDRATLFPAVRQLSAGEFVLFRSGAEPVVERYYSYQPWRADKPVYDPAHAGRELEETLLSIIDEMMKSIGDRQLVVPLSAGRDSRAIVSAAVHLGYSNIRTFAYGRKGNHEVAASKAIAERLGLPWRFVPCTVPMMRSFFSSRDYAAYLDYADSLQSVPFVQDMPQIMQLKRKGYIPDDAVIANGNSGDYISGAHIVPEVQDVRAELDTEKRMTRILDALSNKHFSLWQSLRTPSNLDRIRAQLTACLQSEGLKLGSPENDYGFYEYAEFQDRQTKYVITGERIYEFLGHEWRLPLWDNALLDFFEGIPLEGKIGQGLYAETLERANWGGAWRDIPVNRRTIRPLWLVPLRWLAKAAHAPMGRDAWHRFERRFFQYFLDPTCNSACVPYVRAACDRRGARHHISWLTEGYLNRHSVVPGQPVIEGCP